MNIFLFICLVGFVCNLVTFVILLYYIYKENENLESSTVAFLVITCLIIMCCIPFALYILYIEAIKQ